MMEGEKTSCGGGVKQKKRTRGNSPYCRGQGRGEGAKHFLLKLSDGKEDRVQRPEKNKKSGQHLAKVPCGAGGGKAVF